MRGFSSLQEMLAECRSAVDLPADGPVRVRDAAALCERLIDRLLYTAVFAKDGGLSESCRWVIRSAAQSLGAIPSSVHPLYMARGRGEYIGVTVPAINARGLQYEEARAVFRVAQKLNAGAFILELARSEMGYLQVSPAEYAAVVLAAAIREGYSGPVFIQGDHFQADRKRFVADRDGELSSLRSLIVDAIAAGFYNIDIDASTLVALGTSTFDAEQEPNYQLTAELTAWIRRHEPEGVTISIGGEIGEVGGRNSTIEDLDAFMAGYLRILGQRGVTPGISKISVQTGTHHGGLVLADGRIADVALDFGVLERLSTHARERYGLAGAVQHGASTLPESMFHRFPKANTAEVHLATGFQNLLYENPAFPVDLRQEMYAYLTSTFRADWRPNETQAQFLYRQRKRAFGPFKEQLWTIPEERKQHLRQALEGMLTDLFQQLGVAETKRVFAPHLRLVEVLPPRPQALQEAIAAVAMKGG
ncbi:MAG: class II fructose-bisphosphate aldolase [Chloroflexi bacterium]|nr:class II fructose-bisphosphate aldolase [Chloroflexota bacterium]